MTLPNITSPVHMISTFLYFQGNVSITDTLLNSPMVRDFSVDVMWERFGGFVNMSTINYLWQWWKDQPETITGKVIFVQWVHREYSYNDLMQSIDNQLLNADNRIVKIVTYIENHIKHREVSKSAILYS